MKNLPSTKERVWVVLSHLSAITFGMGILLPIIGWSEQRRKSNYASFQCLQALGYQSLGYTVWLLTYLLLMLVFMVIILVALGVAAGGGNNMDAFMGISVSILLVIVFGILGLYFLLPVIAAIACAFGKDFRYPIMGERLARYLGYDLAQASDQQTFLIEDHEDHWVTAMGHFSVIIMLWGMLAPLTAWILQGKRSLFLKFQSIQTLIYQAGVMALFLGAGFFYMFGFIVLIAMTSMRGDMSALDSSAGIGGLVILFASMLIGILIILVVPLFHILGQWAGYRVLKGDDYHYPVLGNLVKKWMSKSGGEENLK
jgi:uncharacterized Tic20 family protein